MRERRALLISVRRAILRAAFLAEDVLAMSCSGYRDSWAPGHASRAAHGKRQRAPRPFGPTALSVGSIWGRDAGVNKAGRAFTSGSASTASNVAPGSESRGRRRRA